MNFFKLVHSLKAYSLIAEVFSGIVIVLNEEHPANVYPYLLQC